MTAGSHGSAESKRRAQGPPFYKNHFRQCWVPGRSGAPPGPEGYFFDFAFFDFFAFFAFFAFLAIVSSQGFHGLKRDTEACLAEGQPRNILDDNPTRFGGRCRVPSWRCHHVIHSCYAF
jgi:hypothetical protein